MLDAGIKGIRLGVAVCDIEAEPFAGELQEISSGVERDRGGYLNFAHLPWMKIRLPPSGIDSMSWTLPLMTSTRCNGIPIPLQHMVGGRTLDVTAVCGILPQSPQRRVEVYAIM